MPSKPPSPCQHPGCRALVLDGNFCAEHQRARAVSCDRVNRQNAKEKQEEDPRYALAAKIRSTNDWRKAREYVIAQNPLCADPFKFHGDARPALSTTVHHIRPLIDRPDLAFVGENLVALCGPCHNRVEAMERSGKPTAHLFASGRSEPPAATFGIA